MPEATDLRVEQEDDESTWVKVNADGYNATTDTANERGPGVYSGAAFFVLGDGEPQAA